jgi:hypothetical protein
MNALREPGNRNMVGLTPPRSRHDTSRRASMPAKPNTAQSGCKVGPDQIWFVGHRVVIYAASEMPGWQVRGHQKIPVFFQGKKYSVVNIADASSPHAKRYELTPWSMGDYGESTCVIHYDEDYVKRRDQAVQADVVEDRVRTFMFFVWPFLGFFWSHTKQAVIEKHGFSPPAVTKVSLALEFVGVLAWSIHWSFTGGLATVFMKPFVGYTFGEWAFSNAIWVLAALLQLWADCVVRYDDLIRDEDYPSGLMEWPVRKTRRILGHRC